MKSDTNPGRKADPAISPAEILNTAAQFKRRSRQYPFIRYGLPLISLTVLGSVGLAHLIQGSKEVSQEKDGLEWDIIQSTRALTREGPTGDSRPKKSFSLEDELKALQERVDIYNFEYKRVPRPNDGKSNHN